MLLNTVRATHGLGPLVTSVVHLASSIGPGLGAIHIFVRDVGKDLDVGDLGELIGQNSALKLLCNGRDLLGRVTIAATVKQPLGDSGAIVPGAVDGGRIILVLIIVIVRQTTLLAWGGETLLMGSFLESLLLTLADGESPVTKDARIAVALVHVAPRLHPPNGVQDQPALSQGICMRASVAASLIVLATVVNPHKIRNAASAELVTPEDM